MKSIATATGMVTNLDKAENSVIFAMSALGDAHTYLMDARNEAWAKGDDGSKEQKMLADWKKAIDALNAILDAINPGPEGSPDDDDFRGADHDAHIKWMEPPTTNEDGSPFDYSGLDQNAAVHVTTDEGHRRWLEQVAAQQPELLDNEYPPLSDGIEPWG